MFDCTSLTLVSNVYVWLALKIPNLSIYHLLVHTNRDIRGDKTRIRTQQYKGSWPDMLW